MGDDWQEVLEGVAGLVWTTGASGAFEWCGSAARAWFGDTAERWLDAIHPDEREACRAAWVACLAEQRPYRGEHRLRNSSGSFAAFSCESHAVGARWVWTARDITETVTLRASLAAAEAHRHRVETALADSKIGIWLHDLKNDVLVHSRVDGERNPMESIRRGMIPSESERVIAAYRNALADPSFRYDVEFRALEPYGEHWRNARGRLLFDADGRAEWFVGASVDVSAIRRTEEQLELATKLSRVYIWSFRLNNGSINGATSTFVNVWESLGYDPPPGEIDFGAAMSRVIVEEDQPGVWRAVIDCIEGRTAAFEHEYRIRHADGSIHWNLGRGIVSRDDAGQPRRFIGTSVDVTALKRIEAEMRRQQERLELALNGSRACTWEFEPKNGRLVDGTSWFANLVELVGHQRAPDDDFMSLHRRIMPPEEQDSFIERVQSFLDGSEREFEDSHRILHQDGSEHFFLARGVCTRDPATGRAIRLTGVSIDVTEQRRMEVALRASEEQKDQFLAHVSHELRTPMNAILAMTELALDTPQSEHQAQLLTTVQSAAGNLVGIIDDLLDFSKITAGKLTLDLASMSLRKTIHDTVRALTPRAERKGLALRCEIASDVPDLLVADEGRLRQVLMNLVGNAIKFTSKGEVRLEIRVASLDDTALRFEIHDTGIGIPLEHQRSIFGAFMQGDASTTRRYGGTGLGLTISAQLVELMGGHRIAVESVPGIGSTFEFTLRFDRSTREPAVADELVAPISRLPPTTIPPRVLVAEDNELNIAVLRELLEQRGHAADFARDGKEAWALAQIDTHDLLLLDLHMPEMDGFEVVRAIRTRESGRGGHLPIIALTARSSVKDRELALGAGIDDFLSKPIKVNALWNAIDRALEKFPPIPGRARAARLVDHATIIRVSGGHAAVFERLRNVFRESLPGQMARGRAALDDRDFSRLVDAAHRLHGTLSTFSSVAGAVALRLEDAANAKEVARCRDLVVELEAMCTTLLEETKALAFDNIR